MDDEPRFTVTLRGYDRRQVDELVERARTGQDVRDQIPHLMVVLRGYDRQQVESYFNQAAT